MKRIKTVSSLIRMFEKYYILNIGKLHDLYSR